MLVIFVFPWKHITGSDDCYALSCVHITNLAHSLTFVVGQSPYFIMGTLRQCRPPVAHPRRRPNPGYGLRQWTTSRALHSL